jgi:GAF domain-containing protein
LLAKQPVSVEQADTDTMQRILNFAPKVGAVFLVPLLIQHEIRGVLVVASASNLPAECKDALLSLSAEVALALETAALTEDLYRQ